MSSLMVQIAGLTPGSRLLPQLSDDSLTVNKKEAKQQFGVSDGDLRNLSCTKKGSSSMYLIRDVIKVAERKKPGTKRRLQMEENKKILEEKQQKKAKIAAWQQEFPELYKQAQADCTRALQAEVAEAERQLKTWAKTEKRAKKAFETHQASLTTEKGREVGRRAL
uniref:Uncharacterized protein n=1 Tax=Chromera velia CCMP2878 TaxID=1169474 RepID=A0A0G4HJ97_9ALVE|eukprot:Cvel_28052.t1-p1 / transcript=Cvel_28052.t1 / gene=Cvel_28052 / organism=Chromera_velia_CCMP2878 / gene_product=hypothetical protein / transcript_product=hypothetical protein / location=Cvel_scaffold3605:2453-2944(-) / protein_length=164 / sequence_SO=supercontig / SO=protein_coding / is_pseudo=false